MIFTTPPLLYSFGASERAQAFARQAYDSIGLTRKYSPVPYWTHTERVAETLLKVGVYDLDMIQAALFHDIVEDVYPKNKEYSLKLIFNLFGKRTASLVHDLTDVYTKEAFPNYNRRERHAQERIRMRMIDESAKVIKSADILDNTTDIMDQDPKYGEVYTKEKVLVVRESLLIDKLTLRNENSIQKILDKDTVIGQALARR